MAHPEPAAPRGFAVVAAAAGPSQYIGRDAGLPWSLAGEIRAFRALTTTGVVPEPVPSSAAAIASKAVSPSKLPPHANGSPGRARCAVVMGRRTWAGLPARWRPLPGRVNVVITSHPEELMEELQAICQEKERAAVGREPEGLSEASDLVIAVGSFDAGLTGLYEMRRAGQVGAIFVIGGAQLFAAAVQHADCAEIFLTRVSELPSDRDCNTSFPYVSDAFELRATGPATTETDRAAKVAAQRTWRTEHHVRRPLALTSAFAVQGRPAPLQTSAPDATAPPTSPATAPPPPAPAPAASAAPGAPAPRPAVPAPPAPAAASRQLCRLCTASPAARAQCLFCPALPSGPAPSAELPNAGDARPAPPATVPAKAGGGRPAQAAKLASKAADDRPAEAAVPRAVVVNPAALERDRARGAAGWMDGLAARAGFLSLARGWPGTHWLALARQAILEAGTAQVLYRAATERPASGLSRAAAYVLEGDLYWPAAPPLEDDPAPAPRECR